jgi:hypothetical protein
MSRIVVNPEILGGKPIIEGTRISVEQASDCLPVACPTRKSLTLIQN